MHEASFHSSGNPPRAEVDVFREGQSPTRKYKEIAEFSWRALDSEAAKAKAKFIQRAKATGADALIFAPPENAGFVPFSKPGTQLVYKAVAVVYE